MSSYSGDTALMCEGSVSNLRPEKITRCLVSGDELVEWQCRRTALLTLHAAILILEECPLGRAMMKTMKHCGGQQGGRAQQASTVGCSGICMLQVPASAEVDVTIERLGELQEERTNKSRGKPNRQPKRTRDCTGDPGHTRPRYITSNRESSDDGDLFFSSVQIEPTMTAIIREVLALYVQNVKARVNTLKAFSGLYNGSGLSESCGG